MIREDPPGSQPSATNEERGLARKTRFIRPVQNDGTSAVLKCVPEFADCSFDGRSARPGKVGPSRTVATGVAREAGSAGWGGR